MHKQNSLVIRPVRDAESIKHAHALFTAYAATPGIGESLSAQKFQHELATLPAYYTPPGGELLLAYDTDGNAIGCVALRPVPKPSNVGNLEPGLVQDSRSGSSSTDAPILEAGADVANSTKAETPIDLICEIKRLYVTPTAQGSGAGRVLVAAILQRGKELGYQEARLDTLPWMTSAVKVYEKFGFRRIEAYHERWGISNDELWFFAKKLV